MKIKINANNDSLRSILESEGFIFPCGGKGLCGRCKIIAPTLPITEKDRTFIPAPDLENGVRLACDKVVLGEVEIDCLLKRVEERKKKISESDAYVIFEDGRTIVGLASGGEVLDEVILPPTPTEFRALRSTAQRESVELYEEHGLAKATIMLVSGTPQKFTEVTGIIEEYDYCTTAEAKLFDMTAEEVLILPKPTALIGGDILLEMLTREVGTMLVKDGYICYLDDTSLYIARVIPNIKAPLTFVTAVEYFVRKFNPNKKLLVGKNALLKDFELERAESEVGQNSANLLASNRPKAKMDRLARKVIELSLADDELFQDLLSEMANKA